jgi:hypothetical protein
MLNTFKTGHDWAALCPKPIPVFRRLRAPFFAQGRAGHGHPAGRLFEERTFALSNLLFTDAGAAWVSTDSGSA